MVKISDLGTWGEEIFNVFLRHKDDLLKEMTEEEKETFFKFLGKVEIAYKSIRDIDRAVIKMYAIDKKRPGSIHRELTGKTNTTKGRILIRRAFANFYNMYNFINNVSLGIPAIEPKMYE